MEKMKNDLRREMDTVTRISAVETLQKADTSGGSSGAAVNSSVNVTSAPTQAPLASVIQAEETYCGPLTCLILFVLPCICCCPVDKRTRTTHIMN